MAKIMQGILDGFIGKVGTVIGSFWKGLPVMRGYKRMQRDKNSEAQQLVRTRFAALSELASTFLTVLRVGFYKEAARRTMTECDIFMQRNWEHTHSSAPGIATIDYPELEIASGNLNNVVFGTPEFDNPNEIEVDYTAIAVGDDSRDEVYLFAYSPDANQGLLSQASTRGAGSITFAVPANWNGLKVHVWGFTASRTDATRVSKSTYIGSGNIS